MIVSLMAFTQVTPMFDARGMELGWEGTSTRPGELLLEFAGRACYQSWHKPNPKTASTDDYLKNIAAQHHWSVVEHASVSFYVEGVSRSLTHELVRHRHFSFSQLSQRYCDPNDGTMEPVIPPAMRGNYEAEQILFAAWNYAVEAYRDLDELLEKQGVKGKQRREAVRAVLPNMTPTALMVTGNYRSWLEFLTKRENPAADAEIQLLAKAIHHELEKVAPAVFAYGLAEVEGAPKPVQPEYPEVTV